MFEYTTPEKAGISSKNILECLKEFEEYGFATHSIIMMRDDKIFFEKYYAPYNENSLNRIYSVTKSFVAIAIGFLADEGKLSLDDKLSKFFPEYEITDEHMKEQTIRHMLTMQTSFKGGGSWIALDYKVRNDHYFTYDGYSSQLSGALYEYDSPGSYMMGVIVEKLTGMNFLDYMKKKCLTDIGFSNESRILKSAGGYSWTDSAILCTSQDLLKFAHFVLNKGNVGGKQYISEKYMTDAVSYQTFNGQTGFYNCNEQGYGYQIWRTIDNTFSFIGMGDQFAICHPETNSIIIITSDNQGNAHARPLIYYIFSRYILRRFGDALPEDKAANEELKKYASTLELLAVKNERKPDAEKTYSGKTYIMEKNPMGIEWMRVNFSDEVSVMEYKNAQGEKALEFGMNKNVFAYFPEENYSAEIGNIPEPGHKYKCAASACWVEDSKLFMKVQITDDYLAVLNITVSFKGDDIAIRMNPTAEGFMYEYIGYATGHCEN